MLNKAGRSSSVHLSYASPLGLHSKESLESKQNIYSANQTLSQVPKPLESNAHIHGLSFWGLGLINSELNSDSGSCGPQKAPVGKVKLSCPSSSPFPHHQFVFVLCVDSTIFPLCSYFDLCSGFVLCPSQFLLCLFASTQLSYLCTQPCQ